MINISKVFGLGEVVPGELKTRTKERREIRRH